MPEKKKTSKAVRRLQRLAQKATKHRYKVLEAYREELQKLANEFDVSMGAASPDEWSLTQSRRAPTRRMNERNPHAAFQFLKGLDAAAAEVGITRLDVGTINPQKKVELKKWPKKKAPKS